MKIKIGCKDIDDALSANYLGDNIYELGVHIADVSYYVRPNTAMDLEVKFAFVKQAASRSTTTYLVNRRLDMLPKLLTENLCSLVEGQDRFAFSVLWKVKKNGEKCIFIYITRGIDIREF